MRLAAFLMVFLALGCEDKKDSSPKASVSAEPPGPAVDPGLARAMASAAPAQAAGPAPEGDGPPESGVFEPGRADKELAKGAPPKIALGEPGRAPRRRLTLGIEPGWKDTVQIDLSMTAARQRLPPMVVSVALEAQKPKADEASPGTAVFGKVTRAEIGPVEGQEIPAELKSEVAKMKGSRLDFRLLESGAAVDHRYELPKGVDPNLNTLLRAFSETLATAALVYPSEEVGAGAMWLVTSRDFISGADALSYRMFKLESLTDESATISVSTKRYAATTALTMAGLPPGDHRLEQFQASATGSVSARPGALFPVGGDIQQQLNAALIPEGNPDQRMGIQSQSVATVKLGKP